MLEDVWDAVLELIARFVIPDWGAVVALLPVFVLILIAMVLARTFLGLFRAAPARRGKRRMALRTPAGIHMPGPSMAPFLAAIGAALLFLGLVFPGPLLVVGGIALGLALIYWLSEALGIYDREVTETGALAETVPAIIHRGPPPGVHMPGPSFRPFLGADRRRDADARSRLRRLAARHRRDRPDRHAGGLAGGRPQGIRAGRGRGHDRPPREHPGTAYPDAPAVRDRGHARLRRDAPGRLAAADRREWRDRSGRVGWTAVRIPRARRIGATSRIRRAARVGARR
ncbi:MAG: hypothetical protein WKF78_06230 [Candidatus Limnocylindrales bacterium]